jgi:hypothetical protein
MGEHEKDLDQGKATAMGASSYDAGPAGGPDGLTAGCGFPTCDRESVTDHGMCDLHQRVVISRTGSWLEAS